MEYNYKHTPSNTKLSKRNNRMKDKEKKTKWKGRYTPNKFGIEYEHEESILTEIIEEKKGKTIIQTRVKVTKNNNPNYGINANAFKLDELMKTGNFIKPKPIQEMDMDLRERAENAFQKMEENIKIKQFTNN